MPLRERSACNMTSAKEQIVRDIVRIYAKYEASEIADALQALRSGEALSGFVDAVEEVSRRKAAGKERSIRSGQQKKASVPSSKEPLDQLIQTLRQSKGIEYRRLADFLSAARQGRILPSSVDIKRLMSILKVPTPASRDRLSLLRILAEYLAQLSTSELNLILNDIENTPNENSSLQGWANIILRKDPREEQD
jgi:hypothetical protein